MSDPSRRFVLGAAAGAGFVLADSVARAATGAAPAEQQPPALFGQVSGQRVELPHLMNASDLEGDAPNPDAPARRLGIAVVGLGHLTLGEILPGIAQSRHVRLAALVSGNRDKARVVGAQHGLPETALYDYASFDRLREAEGVDIIYIVLPNSMHREFVERAAAAGKHVMCEKPMATSSRDAQAMVDACVAAKRRLMIAYRMQYEPHHRELIRLARSGELGSLRAIEAVNGQNNADNGQWRHIRAMSGGGSLPDVGIYCLNATRYITGEEPVEVTAQLTQPVDDRRFREIEDICSFTLRFPSGVLATCTSGYSHHDSRRLRVMGSDAWAELDPAFAYAGLQMRVGRRLGRADAVDTRRFAEHSQFATEMDHFAEAIRADRTPHTPGEEGVQDHRLMEAIYQAAAGGSVVKLPPVTGRDTTRGPVPAEAG